MFKRFVVAIILIAVLFMDMPGGFAQSPEPEISLHHSWGGEGNVINQGSDMRLTSEGHILVVNGHYNRITRIIPGEEIFQNFGGFGFGEGQLVNASGITTGPDGKIYVAGAGIRIFTGEGQYLQTIMSYDEETGNADHIRDVAIDALGNLHVVAIYSDKYTIKSFTPDGTLINQWITPIGSEIPLAAPISIEMTPENNLIIAEFGDNFDRNGRIVICDTQGFFIKDAGQFNEQDYLEKPSDVAINPANGNIFVVDAQKARIFELSPQMDDLINQWGTYGDAPGLLNAPFAIEFDYSGNLMVLSSEHNIQVFTPEGLYLRSYGIRADSPGQFKTPFDILVSNSGNVYVADSNNNRVQAFDQNGTFLFEWILGNGWARAISEDSNGIVYVTLTDKICKYDFTGLLECWGVAGEEPGQFNNLVDVVVQTVPVDSGEEELVFTIDWAQRIQIFKKDGSHVMTFNIQDFMTGLAVDSSGVIFALNWQGDKVYKYSPDGMLMAETTLLGYYASAIGFGPDGYLYLADQQINRIHHMNPDDLSIDKTWMGDYGDVNTYFHSSNGFDFSEDGLLYLIDVGNARVLVFELVDNEIIQSTKSSVLQSSLVVSAENLVQNGSFENELGSANWTFGGSLPFQRSSEAFSGSYALQLGELSHAGQDHAQAYTTISIPEDFLFPELSFYYQVQSNDSIDNADLFVEVKDGVGLNHLTKIVNSGSEMEDGHGVWKEATLSLNAFRGQTIRINFLARNRTNTSTGILALIDDVQIISKGQSIYIPLISR